MKDIAIDRVMSGDPTTVGVDDTLTTARVLLESAGIHHLPVVMNDRLVGILSSADLLKHFSSAASDGSTRVKDIMEVNPTVLDSRATLRDAAAKLSSGGFHALPVVAQDDVLVGIITSSDLIVHLLHQLPTGDGSLHETTQPDQGGRIGDDEIADIVAYAERAVERGEHNRVAELLLYFRQRNRVLRKACQAAEQYIRSGHAEREHSILVKRLEEARRVFDAHYL